MNSSDDYKQELTIITQDQEKIQKEYDALSKRLAPLLERRDYLAKRLVTIEARKTRLEHEYRQALFEEGIF